MMVRGRPFQRGSGRGFGGRQMMRGSPRDVAGMRWKNEKTDRRVEGRESHRKKERVPREHYVSSSHKKLSSASPPVASLSSHSSLQIHRVPREHYGTPAHKKLRSASPPVRSQIRSRSPLQMRRRSPSPQYKSFCHSAYEEPQMYVEEEPNQGRSGRYSDGGGRTGASHRERSRDKTNRPSYGGGKHFDNRELKSITIDIKRKVPREPETLVRHIFNPEEFVIARRPGEGSKPLFARDDVLCNRHDTEQDGGISSERRQVVSNSHSSGGSQLGTRPTPSKRREPGIEEHKLAKVKRVEKSSRESRDERRDYRDQRVSKNGSEFHWQPDKGVPSGGHGDLRERIRDRKDVRMGEGMNFRPRTSVKERLGGRKEGVYHDPPVEDLRQRKLASQVASQMVSQVTQMVPVWSIDPQSVPKHRNYFEHDNREDMDGGYADRGRGRFRGRFRGRGTFRGGRSPRRRGGFGRFDGPPPMEYHRSRVSPHPWQHDMYGKE